MKQKSVLVLCIDRDDDLGRKTGIEGPVVGRKQVLQAAAKLSLSDPAESDANTMFAAVKKFDEIQKEFEQAEVAALTGYSKTGFESDKRINEQIDFVLERFPADGFILITDGAEDDQTIPILQSRAPIISKEMIIIKQAKEVESTYYTLKEALKDPGIKRIVFLIPGLVIMLWGTLFLLNSEKLFFQTISLVVGVYLILKGTGLEERLADAATLMIKSISLHRVSFPFYLMTILLLILGTYSSYLMYLSPEYPDILMKAAAISQQGLLFITLTGISFVIGSAIDSIHLRKAFLLRRHFLSVIALSLLWFILDSARAVLIGEPHANLAWFTTNILLSFAIALGAYRASEILDVSKKITKLLVGLPVYAPDGEWVGKIQEVFRDEHAV
ncbi:MAG: DUF373 family protein, partial [Candidatus Diapherotrites archaeon]|nr:DUF373 family protein [Candidatus Diapherotrites archaeon]